MYSEVRELLESYEVNSTHLVVRSGTISDGIWTGDVSEFHKGDLTPFGRILMIGFDTVTCENPITETTLKVKVYDYVSDDFIDKTYQEQVKPIVDRYAPRGENEEWCDREDNDRIYLSRHPVTDVEILEGGAIRSIDYRQGIVYGIFSPHVKVKYTSTIGEDVHRAEVLLTASFILGFIGASTGGGSLNVQGYGRNYGARGKYHDVRQELDRNAYQLLQKYVVGMV